MSLQPSLGPERGPRVATFCMQNYLFENQNKEDSGSCVAHPESPYDRLSNSICFEDTKYRTRNNTSRYEFSVYLVDFVKEFASKTTRQPPAKSGFVIRPLFGVFSLSPQSGLSSKGKQILCAPPLQWCLSLCVAAAHVSL